MENKSLKLKMTNDKGVTLDLTLELSFGEQQGLLLDYKVTDATGDKIETMEPEGDIFGFFSMVNNRVGQIMKAAGDVATETRDLSDRGGLN